VASLRHLVVLDVAEHRLDLAELQAVRWQEIEVDASPGQPCPRRTDDPAICRPALSSTTTCGAIDQGDAPRKPSRSYEIHVRSTVRMSSLGDGP
jgi:hypothetical protein